MIKARPKLSRLAAVCLFLVLLTACGGEETSASSDSDGSCDATVEFRGRAYTATATGTEAERGRELGRARFAPCGNEPNGGPKDLTIFTVEGMPLSEAIYVEPGVGLMRLADPAIE